MTMLSTLRHIVQEVNTAKDLDQALGIIVRRVKEAMAIEACTVYLADDENNQYVLMATDGLNPASVGRVRLGRNEGLVGLIGERQQPLNLNNAANHPSYRYFPEKGEEHYRAFLGAPIIHFGKVLGVLVIQQTAERLFNDTEVDFLVTIAAQLAGAIEHAAIRDIRRFSNQHREKTYFFQGIPGAPGIAIGTIKLAYPLADLDSVPDWEVSNQDISAQEAVFRMAVTTVQEELCLTRERMSGALPAEELALFDAYVMLLDSDDLVSETIRRIREGNWAAAALRDTINTYARLFEGMEDAYLRARAEDIRDLGCRVLARLQSPGRIQVEYPQQCVLVGDNVSITQIAEVPIEHLIGIVSQRGSALSHTAILARALGIPAVMGLGDSPIDLLEGSQIVVDGYQGRVYIQPSNTILNEYQRLLKEEQDLFTELIEFRDLPSETPDGVRLVLCVKAGLLADIIPARNSGADGVGLYRTEFAFMVRQTFPDEEEQYRIYREVLESFAPKPVVMRTLDVGGDKPLPYFPIEEHNPFLGWRGIRITLDHPEIFLTQLRAMLRANTGLNNLHLLLPMITGVDQVDKAIRLLERAHHELAEENRLSVRPPLGVMIETPAAIYQLANLARRVDFFSIGTNDLAQYLLAVDRDNARVAHLYDSLHPAVIHAVLEVIRESHRQDKPIGLCGEMADDPAAAILLLGMGIDNLSTTASSLSRIKWVIRSFTLSQTRILLDQALEMESAVSIRRLLNGALEQAGLGRIIVKA